MAKYGNTLKEKEMASPGQRMEIGVIAARYATDDLTHDEAQILIGDPKKAGKVIKAAIREYLKNLPLPLAQMIAAGRYDYVNPDITEEHFPVLSRNRDEYDLEPVHYGKPMSSEAVLKDFAEKGLEPADIADLCEYGEKNPEEQRKHPVVELGSVWPPGGFRDVASLDGRASERRLNLHYGDLDWHDGCRFLARRKSARGG